MDDPVKIYDTTRGGYWVPPRNGYGTVSAARVKKNNNSWSKIFKGWKKKDSSSPEEPNVMSHHHHVDNTSSSPPQYFLPSSYPQVADYHQQHQHRPQPPPPAPPTFNKYRSLSAAMVNPYLVSSHQNHHPYRPSVSAANNISLEQHDLRPLPAPLASRTVCQPKSRKRTSLFGSQWEQLNYPSSPPHHHHVCECTCSGGTVRSHHNSGLSARYPPEPVSCMKGGGVVSSSVTPIVKMKSEAVSSGKPASSSGVMMSRSFNHLDEERSDHPSKSGCINSSSSSSLLSSDPLMPSRSRENRMMIDHHHGSGQSASSAASVSGGTLSQRHKRRSPSGGGEDKKMMMKSSSSSSTSASATVSGGFLRSLKKNSQKDPFWSVSSYRSIPQSVTAYELIKQQFGSEGSDHKSDQNHNPSHHNPNGADVSEDSEDDLSDNILESVSINKKKTNLSGLWNKTCAPSSDHLTSASSAHSGEDHMIKISSSTPKKPPTTTKKSSASTSLSSSSTTPSSAASGSASASSTSSSKDTISRSKMRIGGQGVTLFASNHHNSNNPSSISKTKNSSNNKRVVVDTTTDSYDMTPSDTASDPVMSGGTPDDNFTVPDPDYDDDDYEDINQISGAPINNQQNKPDMSNPKMNIRSEVTLATSHYSKCLIPVNGSDSSHIIKPSPDHTSSIRPLTTGLKPSTDHHHSSSTLSSGPVKESKLSQVECEKGGGGEESSVSYSSNHNYNKKSILKRIPEVNDSPEGTQYSQRSSSSSDHVSSPSSSVSVQTEPATISRVPRKSTRNLTKLRQRRNRKHVTFRSYSDDSLVLEHINEPILEEEEPLYDEILDPEVSTDCDLIDSNEGGCVDEDDDDQQEQQEDNNHDNNNASSHDDRDFRETFSQETTITNHAKSDVDAADDRNRHQQQNHAADRHDVPTGDRNEEASADQQEDDCVLNSESAAGLSPAPSTSSSSTASAPDTKNLCHNHDDEKYDDDDVESTRNNLIPGTNGFCTRNHQMGKQIPRDRSQHHHNMSSAHPSQKEMPSSSSPSSSSIKSTSGLLNVVSKASCVNSPEKPLRKSLQQKSPVPRLMSEGHPNHNHATQNNRNSSIVPFPRGVSSPSNNMKVTNPNTTNEKKITKELKGMTEVKKPNKSSSPSSGRYNKPQHELFDSDGCINHEYYDEEDQDTENMRIENQRGVTSTPSFTVSFVNNIHQIRSSDGHESFRRGRTEPNRILIDVPSGNYGETGQEHIYEEVGCHDSFRDDHEHQHPSPSDMRSIRSMFDGASRDQILEYLEDAKGRVEILINCEKSVDAPGLMHDMMHPDDDLNEDDAEENGPVLSLSAENLIESSVSSSRRNRTSNVSNSSTDSAVTICSSLDDNSCHEDHPSICRPALISSSVSLTQLVERNDSGVGTETSKPHKLKRSTSAILSEAEVRCTDCEQSIDARIIQDDQEKTSASGLISFYPLTCSKCDKKRSERKEIISEFVETEFKYGRDLRIIREEFYRPIQVAGLMTSDQLRSVFLNLNELIEVNSLFSEKLQDALDIATEQGDEEFTTVSLGKLFSESSAILLDTFEWYCSRIGSASLTLTQLEKEKELLRIFLRVSQMENTHLRRMNLSAFLMVPVQRVTKYPLLLNRLFKVTPYHHRDREALKSAQQKVEQHLDQINQQTKPASNKIWRRISSLLPEKKKR